MARTRRPRWSRRSGGENLKMRTRVPLAHNSSTIHYFIANPMAERPIPKRWDKHAQFKQTWPNMGGMRSPGTNYLTYIAADGPVVYRPE